MSNKELDNLFRNKLEQLAQKPSAEAWKKIQASTLGKKAAPALGLRVAAAALLLVTSGLVIWQATKNDDTNNAPISALQDEHPSETQGLAQVQPEATPANAEESSQIVPPEASQSALQAEKAHRDEALALNKVPKQSTIAKKKITAQEKQTPTVIENLDVQENIAANELTDATIETEAASDLKKADQGRTLEFNLSDFEKTALATQEKQPADKGYQVEEEEGKSKKGLNKVIDLMKELKSEANIGELREAKNELFAFNFKKENKDDSE